MKPNKCIRCGSDMPNFTAIICEPCFDILSPPPMLTRNVVKASILFGLAILLSAAVMIATK